MKLLLLPLFLLGACAGTYRPDATSDVVHGIRSSAEGSFLDCPPTACPTSACQVSVEPTPRGTCLITCRSADGEIVCQEEVACDEPCPKPCEESALAESCSR